MKIKSILNVLFFVVLLIIILSTIYYCYHLKDKIGILERELASLEKKLGIIENRSYKFKLEELDFSVDENLEEYQKIIAEHVNKNINKLAPEKPSLGGRWIVSSLKFLSPDIISVWYEDGHDMNSIYLKVESAYKEIMIERFW